MTENSRDYISELAIARQNLADAEARVAALEAASPSSIPALPITSHPPSLLNRFDIRVSLGYGILATLWILFSDRLLAVLMTEDLQASTTFSLVKGLGFVWLTAFVLYIFVRSELRRRNRVENALDRDIMRRKQAVNHAARLNRTLSVLSDVNQSIVRTRDRSVLFDQACQIAVEKGEFRMAWIGLFDRETQQVSPVAHAGVAEDYLQKLNISLNDVSRGNGPAGQSIRTAQPAVVNNIATDPAMLPWREDALRLQYNSIASLPLIIAGDVRGMLALYHKESDFFDTEELKLVEEMAGDIAFAMEFIEQDNQRKLAEQQVKHLNRTLNMLSDINQAIVRTEDTKTLFEDACKLAVEKGGFRMAWIGIVDPTTKRADPVTSAGLVGDYLEVARKPGSVDYEPTAIALKIRKHVVINDIATDPIMERLPWRDDALRMGYRSSVALPILVKGESRGIYHLYSEIPQFFDDQELKLLDELAGDIGFAMEFLEQEHLQQQAEEALQRYVKRIEILHEIDSGIIASTSIRSVIDVAMGQIREIIPCQRISVMVLDQPTNEWVIFVVNTDLDSPLGNGIRIPNRSTPAEQRVSGQIAVTEDLRLIPNPSPELQQLIKDGLVSGLHAHFMVANQSMGSLNLFAATPNYFTVEHQEIVSQIANQIGIAIRQMQLAEEVRESEAQYRLLAENMVDVIWVLDVATGRFTYVSPSIQQLRGYTPEEVLAQPMADSMTPASLQMIQESLPLRISAFLAGDPAAVSQSHQIEQPCKDGSTIWTEVVTTILQDEDGALRILGVTRDISERRKAESELREREEWIRLSMEASGLGKWRYNIAEGIIRFDERGREHYGFDHDSITVDEVLARIHPEDVERFKREMASTLDPVTQNKRAMEYRVIHPDGSVRWVSALATIYFEGEGETRHALYGFGTSQDITDRKNAEEKLRQTEERYRKVVEDQTDFICRYTADHTLTFVNQAYADLYQKSADELIGHNFFDLMPEVDRIASDAYLATLSVSNPVTSSEHRSLLPDGSERWIQWTDRVLFDDLGNVIEYQGVGRDVTDRKLAEQAINRQNAILQQSRDLIALAGLDSKLIYMNSSGAALAGYESSDAVLGTLIENFYAAEDMERIRKEYMPIVTETGQWRGENRLKKRNGELVDVDQTIFTIHDENGNIKYLATIMVDITEQKQARDALYQSEMLFQEFMSHLPGTVFITDPQHNIKYCNPRYAESLNVRREDIIGKQIADYLNPDVVKLFLAENEDVLFNMKSMEFNYSVTTGDQTKHWLLIKFPIPQLDSEPLIGGITLDVTKEKNAEAALRQSEAQQRAILSALPDIMFRYGADGTFLDYHAPDVELLAAPPEMFLGKKAHEVLPTDLADELLVSIEKVIKTREPIQSEYQLAVPSGLRDFESRLVPVGDNEVLAVVRDVTDRKLAEQELESLYNATSYLFKADSLLNLGHQIVAAVVREFEHADCGLMLLDKGQNKIMRLARTGQYDIQPEVPLTLNGRGLVPQALRTRQIVYAPDVTQDPNYVPSEARTQSEFVIPLKTANGVIGVLDLQRNEKNAFSDRDRRILTAYAERAAPAIETMQLYEELNLHAADLEWRVAQRTAEVNHAKERAEAILNNSTDAIVLFDAHQRIQQGNMAFHKLFGIQIDEYFEKPLFDLLEADDAAKLKALLEGDQSEIQGRPLEVRVMRKNGTSFEAELSLGFIKNSGLVCIIRDVTARKQSERAVAEERNLLRTLIDALPDYIYVKDLNHKTILSNLARTRSFGLENSEDTIGKDDFDLLPAEMATKFHAEEDRLFQTLEPLIDIEDQTLDENGSLIWVESTKVPLRNLNGDLIGLVGVTRNITERKERERRLRFDAAIQASISDAVIVFDEAFIVRSWNKAAETIYGWRDTEVIGKNVTEVLQTRYESEAASIEMFQTFLSKGHWDGEYIQKRKDGAEVYIQTSTSLFKDENDVPIGIIAVNRDITKQKQAEVALRNSEQMLINVIENIPVRVFWKDHNSVYQGSNSLHARAIGLASRVQIIGKRDIDLTDSETAAMRLQHDHEVMETGIPKINMESSVKYSDGSIRWLNSNKVALRNADGETIGILVTTEDITDRKQAEQALRDSELRFGLLVNGVRDYAIYLVDTNGKVVTWNQGAERIKGYSAQEIIGQHISKFYTADDIAKAEPERMLKIAAIEGHYTTEGNRVRKDGTVFWAEIAVTALRDSSGNLFGYAKVTHDLSERRKAQETLRLSEERYRLLAENITDIIARVTPEGVYIDVSPSTKSVLGYDTEEMIGKSGADFIHPDDVAGVLQKRQMLLETRSEAPITYRFRHRDGHYIWLEVARKLIISKETNTVKEYVTSSRDITIRKRAEEALKNALEKEKELNELKSRFVSMASHEFRTPLATILATSETLSAYRSKLSENQIADKLAKIADQVSYLKAIIEDTLQVARLQDPKAKYEPVDLDLDAVCRSVIDEFESRPDVTQHFVYSCVDTLQVVRLDRKLIRQIINNLLSNAVKYSGPDKEIWITLERLDGALVLKVRDLGIGIPEPDLKHLFEPFHRATNVGTIPGTGLGLVIAKEAVELQGGLMTVDSKVGEGTTFTIMIPFEFAEGT